ncbi:MAG: hypothetical protein LKG40_02315 [Lachnospiraceae bacterium]|nr:hypothetical protein [Lachnospiraceae bacterium]MCI1327605.1 hypothetical protein [Lachnospiraceae bacterium]
MARFMKRLLGTIAGGTAALAVAVKPRITGKPDMHEIEKYDYANRGFTDGGVCLPDTKEAFQRAVDHGYGIRTKAESPEMLQETLTLINGQVPVILTLEPETGSLYRFCEKLFPVLDEYEGVFAIESVDPRVLSFFRSQREEYIRGQIVDSAYVSGYSFREQLSDFAIRNLLLNTKTEPDFISCSIRDRKTISLLLCRLIYRIPIVDWIVRDMHEYEQVRTDDQIVVFESIEP